ncbi:MAG TPA: ATP-binding protein [Methylomirabilota bacterium]|jgi:signal transduction histidine kinase
MHLLKHPIITRFSLLCLLGTVVLGLGMGYAISALLTQGVSEWEWQNTAALVRREVEREGLQRIFSASADRASQERWGRALSATITTLPEVVRVKVWSRDAEILWSDEAGLIGQRFPGNDELRGALAGDVEVEQRYEQRAFSTLAEVYVPIVERDGRVLGVIEVYKTPDRLQNTIRWSRIVIWAISVVGGAMFYLVLLPLLMQVYRRQVQDEMLRQHAARLQEQVEHRTQQFMQAQKMQALGLLAGGIAHDFNNMLTVIFGRAQVLLDRLPEDARARQDADAIGEAAERAATLTRQLLAFSRKQLLERCTLDLNNVIADMAQMLRRLIGENITVVTALPQSAAWVNVDRGQLEQVILNLAVNARDAMPRGGHLTLTTESVESDGADGLPSGRFVALVVSDTGVGMDAATRERIFEPFFTTKPVGVGTGLGLATVYGVVEQHGGHIAVDSAPGRGTTFRVYLPSVDEPAPQAVMPLAMPRTGSETILVAEDDPAVRALATDMLREHGYTVLAAADGEEALLVAERHTTPIHLLLTDVMMPRMNGLELARAFGSIRPHARVLYMTGYAEMPAAADGIIVQKPFSVFVLMDAVRRALEAAPRADYATSIA